VKSRILYRIINYSKLVLLGNIRITNIGRNSHSGQLPHSSEAVSGNCSVRPSG